ncbi:MAG: hypothetical protein V4792_16825 [Pseudomonadota bacterium]
MTIKLLEIRDAGTTIPAMAIQVSGADGWLLRRAGFGEQACIYLIMLATQRCAYDPYHWNGGARTMPIAHIHIIDHWDDLTSGDVVDVEFILGATSAPKVSEQAREAQ